MGHTSRSTPTQAEGSIIAGVNEARFLQHMGTLFSSSTTVLAELMQNARRAGATKVQIELDTDTRSLVVTDDGCGVANFQQLILVAESGWSQEVIESEKPFGIGFSSASFAAGSVVVQSRGKQVEFSAEDLIRKSPIIVIPSDFIGGTRVSLRGLKPDPDKIRRAAYEFARGFPIPVILNGDELLRPHAMDILKGESSAVGWLHIPWIHGDAKLSTSDLQQGKCYYQGLPVAAGEYSTDWPSGESVVHLDANQWRPRVPDRDALIDQDIASEAIREAIRSRCMAQMQHDKLTTPAEQFAERYWQLATYFDCLATMNEVPYLPAQVLYGPGGYPSIENSGNYECRGTGVTRGDVEAGLITLCTPTVDSLHSDHWARAMFAKASGWIFVNGLPDGHWASTMTRDLLAATCCIAGTVVKSASFSGGWVSAEVKILENMRIVLDGEAVEPTDALALGNEPYCASILIPKGCKSHASVALSQLTDYRCDNGDVLESDREADAYALDNLVAVINGEPSYETLRKCIVAGDAGERPNLPGQRFSVSFDKKGMPTVMETPDLVSIVLSAGNIARQHNLLSTATDEERRATLERHLDWWNSMVVPVLDAIMPLQEQQHSTE